jgi:peptidoglycan/xylan/chitin deacetylase (PgdA/CDA1 family)
MYHRIADVPGDRNAVPPAKFREQMEYLAANGFTTVNMQMVYDLYVHGKRLPKRPVLLTFDDGYLDNFETALPILEEKNMTAVVFPITNWIGRENKWEDFHKELTTTMDWPQLKAWQAAGMEIASHTVNHPALGRCSNSQMTAELKESKAVLEKKLACSIDFLCYPYGNFNAETKAAARQAGYKAAFAIFKNVSLWHIDLFALPRIPIPARQSLFEFKLKVSSVHVMFIALRLWEQSLKRLIRRK